MMYLQNHNPNLSSGMLISIKSLHGTYLSANPNFCLSLASHCKEWEMWTVEQIGNCFAFRSHHNSYLRANQNNLVDLSPQCKQWEVWTMERHGGTIALKSFIGTYLRANLNNTLDLTHHCREWEMWVINEQDCHSKSPHQQQQGYQYQYPQFHKTHFLETNFHPHPNPQMFQAPPQHIQNNCNHPTPQRNSPLFPRELHSPYEPHFPVVPQQTTLHVQNQNQEIRNLYHGSIVTVKSMMSGTFIRADPKCSVGLVHGSGDWERWTVEQHGNKYALKSFHGSYLSANPNSVVGLSPQCHDWEKWSLQVVNCGPYILQSHHFTYLRGEPNGSVSLVPFAREHEQWVIN